MSASLILVLAVLSAAPQDATSQTDMPFAAPATPARLQQAVAGGLGYLADEGLKWRTERSCASCHHAPEMLWAIGEARAAGLPVDEALFSAFTAWSLSPESTANVLPPPGDFYHLVPAYLSLGLSRHSADDPAIREGLGRLATYIVSKQGADGAWSAPEGRPPLFEKPEAITLLSVLALSHPALAFDPAQPQYAAARDKALGWLAANPTNGEHQSLVLRLLAKVATTSKPEELRPLIDDLLARQDANGGWRQTPDMNSDAFATGQSLYALRVAGITADDAAIRAGAAFLVNSQSADGSWTMTSRPHPTTGATGANVAPITYAGTAWGVIGLARCALE